MSDKLFKRTTTGDVQVWWIEIDEDKYCTHSGRLDGKIVQSKWTVAKPKNVGKANETTGAQQALLEVAAKYTKQKKLGYHESIENIDDFVFVQPMLAKSYDDYSSKIIVPNSYWSSPKLDGIRCILTARGAFSRKGEQFHTVPHLIEAMAPYFEKNPTVQLDGELYNHSYKDDFNKIQSLVMRKKPTADDLEESRLLVQYHIYDTISDDPFEVRNAMAEEAVMNCRYDILCLVHCNSELVTSYEHMDEMYGSYLESGFEGQMLRCGKSGYENKRTKNLLKRKEFQDKEFLVLDIIEGIGNRSGIAGFIQCRDKETGVEFSSGIRGSHEFARQLLIDRYKYINGDVTVRFQNLTPDGIPRFPVAVAFFPEGRNL